MKVEKAGYVLRDVGGVRRIDTRAMEWEPLPVDGLFRKVLSRDADGEPSAMLTFVPPGGFLPGGLGRQFHRSVRVFAYVVEGELVVWEYESAGQVEGDLIRAKAGFFMDRRPGSIYGVEAGQPRSATGALVLNWREGGPGIWAGERDYETETVAVPFGDGGGFAAGVDEPHEAGGACVRNRGGVTWLDTREMAWETMPMPGWVHRVLVRDEAGDPSVTINYHAPRREESGSPLPAGRHRHYHRSTREFNYLVAGEGVTWEYTSPEDTDGEVFHSKQGYFMDRAAGSIHGTRTGQPNSATGQILVCWREGGSGIFVGERGYEQESVEVPYELSQTPSH